MLRYLTKNMNPNTNNKKAAEESDESDEDNGKEE